jgi:hypothetical protein
MAAFVVLVSLSVVIILGWGQFTGISAKRLSLNFTRNCGLKKARLKSF